MQYLSIYFSQALEYNNIKKGYCKTVVDSEWLWKLSVIYFFFSGKLITESNSAPQKFSSFVPLKYTSIYRDGGDIDAVEYHFLLSSHGAYIYNQKVVLAALGDFFWKLFLIHAMLYLL